jgi:hypothetical protein
MQNVRTRVELLERSRSSTRGPDTRATIVRQALRHLSMEELNLLESILKESVDGKIRRDLTRQESDAVTSSNRALELECRRAGFRSLTEFQHSYSATRRR